MAFQRGLGRREREILTAIWMNGSASIVEITKHLSSNLAHTTVSTLVTRLAKKGFLQSRKAENGKAFIYSAISPREVEDRRAAELVRRFFSESNQHPDLLLSCFVEAVHQYDTELLHHLEARISQKRALSVPAGGVAT